MNNFNLPYSRTNGLTKTPLSAAKRRFLPSHQLMKRPTGSKAFSKLFLCFIGFSMVACDSADQAAVGSTDQKTAESTEASGSAAQPRPAWLPEAIVLPADFKPHADRSIGKYTKILQGVTDADPDDLISEYREALDAAGYQVDDRADLVEQGVIRYQGKGLQEASIRFTPKTIDVKARLLQFDARVENR